MTTLTATHNGQAPAEVDELAARLIPDEELQPWSVDAVTDLPSFASRMRECERICGVPYSEVPLDVQDALVLRRLRQMVNSVLLNPLWRERLNASGVTGPPASYEEWEQIPLSDKTV